MKTLLLITLASGLAISTAAQQGPEFHNNDRNDTRSSRYDHTPVGYDNQWERQHELEMRIAAINKHYDSRINDVQHQPYLRAKDRRKQIKQLQKERNLTLKECRDKYSTPYAAGYGKSRSDRDRH